MMKPQGLASLEVQHHRVGRVRGWLLAWERSSTTHIWLRRALLLYVVAVFLIRIHHEGDFAGYLRVGALVLQGDDPYRSAGALNTWPPFFSILCVPLALLAYPSAYVARGVWFVLNFAALWWTIGLIAQLVYGQSLRWRQSDGVAVTSPWVLVPLVLSERYVSSNFDHVQINLILFALVLAGLKAQAEGKWIRGGGLLALAAAIKLLPLTFLAYFAWRRRWRALLSSGMIFLALSLSPVFVWGWDRFFDYLLAWRERVSAGWGVGRLNQSVWAMWDRWLGHGMVPLVTPGAHDIPSSGSAAVPFAVAATFLVFVALFWWRSRKGEAHGWKQLCEWSFVLVATPLFSPVTWKAYLAVALLPNTLLFATWWQAPLASRARRAAMVGLVASAITNLLSPGLLGRHLAARIEMACVPTILGLVLLAALVWISPYLAGLEAREPSESWDAGRRV